MKIILPRRELSIDRRKSFRGSGYFFKKVIRLRSAKVTVHILCSSYQCSELEKWRNNVGRKQYL